ncbi:MAG: AtpZ/AtpI family protein [Saprospiraceae bacterium]|nr:AtpZ/AtpI family protein [Saprospiraceae bacterium]
MEQSNKNKNRTTNDYLRYSGMAIQIGLTILVGAYIGKWLDKYFETPKPYFTTAFCLFFTFAAMYLNLRDILFDPKNDKLRK